MPILNFSEVEYLRAWAWIRPEQIKCVNALVKKWHRIPTDMQNLPCVPHLNEFNMTELSGDETLYLIRSWVDAEQLSLICNLISDSKTFGYERVLQHVKAKEEWTI